MKVSDPGLDYFVKTALYMKEMIIEKVPDKVDKQDELSNAVQTSMLYVGHLRSRLTENFKKGKAKGGRDLTRQQ